MKKLKFIKHTGDKLLGEVETSEGPGREMKITSDLLFKYNACEEVLEVFAQHYPEGLEWSPETQLALLRTDCRAYLGWLWAVIPATKLSLKGANLTGANLQEVDLRRANLSGASLTGADLYGADLTGTKR